MSPRIAVYAAIFICALVLGLSSDPTSAAPPGFGRGVAHSPHNLSVKGPGPVRATGEQRICFFCHTPHSPVPAAPMWNRRQPGTTYTPYSSSTAVATPGQPTGVSVLCLSCHDGTIALGEVVKKRHPIRMARGVRAIPVGPGWLGTDLSDDHPISFHYDQHLANTRGELADPGTLAGGPVKLDVTGQLQCTTCHDAHDDSYGKFLVMSNDASALCTTCHLKDYWSLASHRLSTAGWNHRPPDPWPNRDAGRTVAENACENCHVSHSAGSRERLLLYEIEEANCDPCHNGNVADTDITAEFRKPSVHPVMDTTGVHEPNEPAESQARHVECVDCHDPHAVSGTGLGGAAPGALNNVRGIELSRTPVRPVSATYQVCFRCHADSPDKPPAPVGRVIDQTNTRLEFDLNNPSFHPVAGRGRNSNVPSLITPLIESSTIGCGDCHNNDDPAGPRGPHGSIYEYLLVAEYEMDWNNGAGGSAYALCYRCHSQDVILSDERPSFTEHKTHIVDAGTPCSVCHDPHGISSTQGNSENNAHLINFDISIVGPLAGDPESPRWVDGSGGGNGRGECWLVCHSPNSGDVPHCPTSAQPDCKATFGDSAEYSDYPQ